jgi:hypothetical protein
MGVLLILITMGVLLILITMGVLLILWHNSPTWIKMKHLISLEQFKKQAIL